jgi:hypothetical protein
MTALNAMQEVVANHRVDEFYAWNDFKTDMRELRREGNALLDSLDDVGADLSEGLDTLLDFSAIESAGDDDPSRNELRFHVWQ